MKKLLLVVVVLLVLLVGAVLIADGYVRGMAESQAEDRIAERLTQVEGVHVELEGFPFVLRVLLSGEIEGLHVRIDRVRESGLEAHDLSLDVSEIQLDEDALMSDQRLVLTDIGEATAQGFITDDAVSALVKQTIRFSPGSVHAEIRGEAVQAKAGVKGRMIHLMVDTPGVPPVIFPLPPKDVLPCKPELELLEGEMRLSCSIDALPDSVKEAMAAGA